MNAKLAVRLLIIVGIILLAVYAGNVSLESGHRIMDGIADQVYPFRNRVRAYYLGHGHPPSRLADVLAVPSDQHDLWFGTTQELKCHLVFSPCAKPTSRLVRVTCGDPLVLYFEIAGDGSTIQERWRRPLWLRALWQRGADYPALRTYFLDNRAK